MTPPRLRWSTDTLGTLPRAHSSSTRLPGGPGRNCFQQGCGPQRQPVVLTDPWVRQGTWRPWTSPAGLTPSLLSPLPQTRGDLDQLDFIHLRRFLLMLLLAQPRLWGISQVFHNFFTFPSPVSNGSLFNKVFLPSVPAHPTASNLHPRPNDFCCSKQIVCVITFRGCNAELPSSYRLWLLTSQLVAHFPGHLLCPSTRQLLLSCIQEAIRASDVNFLIEKVGAACV